MVKRRGEPTATESLGVGFNIYIRRVSVHGQSSLPPKSFRLMEVVRQDDRLGELALPRHLRSALGRTMIYLGAPRRRDRGHPREPVAGKPFEVATFVNDDALYTEMCRSFVAAGFDPDSFIRLSDDGDTPYAAINRIGLENTSRYAVLCHQDVRLDQGYGQSDLLSALEQLDAKDPSWVVAGNAGVTRRMLVVRRLVDPHGGSTGEELPLAVISLDENFLVFNRRCPPRCTPGLAGFHLYATDVCLNALVNGGQGYVIDFPVTHLSSGNVDSTYAEAKERFLEAWNARCQFRYVSSPQEALFVSRSASLRRVFGSSRAITWVAQHRRTRTNSWRAPVSDAHPAMPLSGALVRADERRPL